MNSKISTAAIIQARMNSKRFPGKVMSLISNKTMLEFQLERIKLCESIDEVIIATTISESDNVIEALAKKLSIKVLRGKEEDVLSRYVEASKLTNAKTLVRITADCPLIDPLIIHKVISIFKLKNLDYASNINPPSFPDGLDVEVFSKEILFKADSLCQDPLQNVPVWMLML